MLKIRTYLLCNRQCRVLPIFTRIPLFHIPTAWRRIIDYQPWIISTFRSKRTCCEKIGRESSVVTSRVLRGSRTYFLYDRNHPGVSFSRNFISINLYLQSIRQAWLTHQRCPISTQNGSHVPPVWDPPSRLINRRYLSKYYPVRTSCISDTKWIVSSRARLSIITYAPPAWLSFKRWSRQNICARVTKYALAAMTRITYVSDKVGVASIALHLPTNKRRLSIDDNQIYAYTPIHTNCMQVSVECQSCPMVTYIASYVLPR